MLLFRLIVSLVPLLADRKLRNLDVVVENEPFIALHRLHVAEVADVARGFLFGVVSFISLLDFAKAVHVRVQHLILIVEGLLCTIFNRR